MAARTSRPEPRASGPHGSRPSRSGNTRRRTSPRRHEPRSHGQTTDDADRELPGTRSRGRSQALLYNEVRPHGALGNKPPVSLMTSRRRSQPADVTKPGKLYLPAVQRWGADQSKPGLSLWLDEKWGSRHGVALSSPPPRRLYLAGGNHGGLRVQVFERFMQQLFFLRMLRLMTVSPEL